jgi:DNA polymerase-3 subunit delta
VVLPEGTKHVTAEIVEKNIGVSKEYDIFELQKALAEKDVLKSNRIVDYFGTNPNAYPMVKVISILYPYFAKLLRFHFVRQRPPAEQASLLGVSPYFLREYETAARRYSPRRLVDIIHLLHIYDARAKGAEGTLSASSHAMLKELVYKILH